DAPRSARCRGTMVDEQPLVLEHREDRLVGTRDAGLPGADVGRAVRIGDDRRQPRLERRRNVTVGHESHVRIAELEATVERGDQEVNLARRYLTPVGPADRAAVAGAGVEV